jgi:hypothetical protein
VWFLWAKDIDKDMLPMYGEHCLSRQAVHNWVQKLLEGRTSIEDEHRFDRPAKLQRVGDIIRTTDYLVSEQTAYQTS